LVAQALGVSTTPVRDAIIRLIGVGALVNLGLKTVVVSVLTMVTLVEVTKIRSVLESLAAFEATTHTDDSDIEFLDTTQSQINSATDGRSASPRARRHSMHRALPIRPRVAASQKIYN
jgi:DNA-binding GntR family transcriptional regulator